MTELVSSSRSSLPANYLLLLWRMVVRFLHKASSPSPPVLCPTARDESSLQFLLGARERGERAEERD